MNLTRFSKILGVVNRTAGRPKKVQILLPSALPKKCIFRDKFREELARAKNRGSPPTTIQHSTPARRKKPSAVGRGGFEVFPLLRLSNSPMRQKKHAKRPRRAQRKEGTLRPQQQPTPSQSKTTRVKTSRLQGKETPALL
jgi:hypothetical protein